MKKFNLYLVLSLMLCGFMHNNAQADRGGRYAAAGLGGFAAGTFLGAALGSRPVYYNDYYDPYYYPYNAPYYDVGYYDNRPYEYRHDYYRSADGAPYRPKN